jgi:hypothetical protein
MSDIFVALVFLFVRTTVLAAAIAVIVNLPIPAAFRFLVLLIGLWAIWMIRVQLDVEKRLQRIEQWSRLAYIASHLRNEQEGIQSARERLRDDLEIESIDIVRREKTEAWVNVASLAALLATVAVLLHFGVFGQVGVGWLSTR